MTKVWRVFDKSTGRVYGEFLTDRDITLDEAIEFAHLSPFYRVDENGNVMSLYESTQTVPTPK